MAFDHNNCRNGCVYVIWREGIEQDSGGTLASRVAGHSDFEVRAIHMHVCEGRTRTAKFGKRCLIHNGWAHEHFTEASE